MHNESFIFLPGVRSTTEHNIWKQGISDWTSFLSADNITGFSWKAKRRHDMMITMAQAAVDRRDAAWFAEHWPVQDTWRLFDVFSEDALYLDIETDGGRTITMIGMYIRDTFVGQILGKNMNKGVFVEMLRHAKMLVTFNGLSFDWPMLSKFFGIKMLGLPHVDLRHVCSKIGLNGGLKNIEKTLGISRGDGVEHATGADAVLMYELYRRQKREEYLEHLIRYNQYDTENLALLAQHVIPALWELTTQTHRQTA